MTETEFDALVVAVATAVRQAIESAQPLPPKLMFDFDEASELTGIPAHRLKRLAETGEIPSCKVGRYRKLSKANLDWVIENSTQQATSGELLAREKAKAKAAARAK